MYVVLVYDISQEKNGARRWSRIFKICKKYLSHIQDSVFEGELSNAQLERFKQELKGYINKELDSVILFKSRQEKWLDKEFWGKKMTVPAFFSNFCRYPMCFKDREIDNSPKSSKNTIFVVKK